MNIFKKILNKYKKDGLVSLFLSTFYWTISIYPIDKVVIYLSWPFYKILESKFEFDGKIYRMFFHPYNKTWTNERMIELPIIHDLVKNIKNKDVLEIGNVLSHYYKVNHKILDLYERGKNVINEDVINISSLNKNFDLIVSISTMEHVGWDWGEKKEEDKIKLAIEFVKKSLTDSGFFIFTVPLGYNKYLDELIKNNYFKNVKFIKRYEKRKWSQVNKNEPLNFKFAYPFNAANTVAIIRINKSEK